MGYRFLGCPVSFCSGFNISLLIEQPSSLLYNNGNFDPGSYENFSLPLEKTTTNQTQKDSTGLGPKRRSDVGLAGCKPGVKTWNRKWKLVHCGGLGLRSPKPCRGPCRDHGYLLYLTNSKPNLKTTNPDAYSLPETCPRPDLMRGLLAWQKKRFRAFGVRV